MHSLLRIAYRLTCITVRTKWILSHHCHEHFCFAPMFGGGVTNDSRGGTRLVHYWSSWLTLATQRNGPNNSHFRRPPPCLSAKQKVFLRFAACRGRE
jgi:hypothetical protein